MRKILGGIAATALACLSILPSSATATGFTSSNVEYVSTVPFEAGVASGGRLLGNHFYVAGAKSFSIYDVTDPIAPTLVSITPTGLQFPNEDVDTNGKVLLISDDTVRKVLQVWDVENKAAPTKVAELPAPDHTFTCVLDCKWAYGARGTIVDLREPAAARVAGNWMPGMAAGYGFDTTEVAPGLVLTSTRVIHLLDARKNPAKPKVLALGTTTDNRLIHSNRWPNGGRDKFFLVQGETPFSQTCNESSGALMTWDASRWKRTRTFQVIDEFRVTNGTYVDGNPPAGVFGCTNMWFQEHPSFKNGGLVASGFFEHGARFLRVDSKGAISEVGYFTPVGGSTIATYWITDDIVYAIDLQRGIDILRFSGE